MRRAYPCTLECTCHVCGIKFMFKAISSNEVNRPMYCTDHRRRKRGEAINRYKRKKGDITVEPEDIPDEKAIRLELLKVKVQPIIDEYKRQLRIHRGL